LVVGIAFLAFFAIVMWRGGSSNPVGTGQLQRQLNTVGSKVTTLEASVQNCASTGEVEQLRRDLKDMEARVASSGEIIALEGQIASVNMRIAGIEQLAARTDAGVARIEGYFLEKGIKG
jgi:hypothetical protein